MMIITDSASDITRQEAEEMNIRIVWLKTKFSDGDFPLETEEDFTRFFEKLAAELWKCERQEKLFQRL